MTAQTTAYLKATEFTLTGLVGRITPQNMVDTVDTLLARTSSPVNITIPEYGAIGDGLSHPLSGMTTFQGLNSTGWTLTQWRAIFSFATATTNEINWCAVQLAINVIHASGSGGSIYSPAGKYIYTNSNSVSDGSGTLTFPETGSVDSGSLPLAVNWVGDGFTVTLHAWPNDLGTGHFAVTCTNRLNTVTGSVGMWRDMSFVGPNNAVAFGAKPANMHAIGWAEYRTMVGVKIAGFNGGLCLNSGGQTIIDRVEVNNCYFGFYFDSPNVTGDHGDMLFTKCAATNCTRAGLGVGRDTECVGALFVRCGFFTSPYGVFKETGGSSDYCLEEVTFLHTQFEQIGNAWISDGLAAGSHVALMGPNVKFENSQYQYNGAFAIAAEPHTGIFCFASNFGAFEIIRPNTAGLIPAAVASQTNGLFEIDAVGGLLSLVGDMQVILPGFVGVAPIGTGNFNSQNCRIEHIGLSPWKGTVFQVFGNPTIIVGDVLAFNSNSESVALSAGNTTELIAGICMLSHNGISSGPTVCAREGRPQFVNARSNVIADGTLVRAGASGSAITSSGQFQTTSQNIGMWLYGSGASPNRVGQLHIRGII